MTDKPEIPTEGMPIILGCPRCGHFPPKDCGYDGRYCEKCSLIWIEIRKYTESDLDKIAITTQFHPQDSSP